MLESFVVPQSRYAVSPPGFGEDLAAPNLLPSHLHWLRAALRRRFGADAADDLVQEAFLRATRSPPDAAVRRPRAWLLTVAINAARDQFRRQAVRPTLADDGDVERLAVSPDQEQALLLKQVILALPPHLKDVFLLSRFGGLTYEEIARRCGISVKTVEWRMTKALGICAAQLRD